jgi:putative tryptophan/tyrosine transport system substrate-binding protein
VIANASTPSEIETTSANLVGLGIGALPVSTDVLVGTDVVGQFIGLAARRDVPAIYPLRQFAEAGGLMSYEANLSDAFQLAAVYTARVIHTIARQRSSRLNKVAMSLVGQYGQCSD